MEAKKNKIKNHTRRFKRGGGSSSRKKRTTVQTGGRGVSKSAKKTVPVPHTEKTHIDTEPTNEKTHIDKNVDGAKKSGDVHNPEDPAPIVNRNDELEKTISDIVDIVERIETKMAHGVVKNAADFVGITIEPEDLDDINELLEYFEPNIRKVVLDALGIIPGIGEVVEITRLVGDLSDMSEKYKLKASKIISVIEAVKRSNQRVVEKINRYIEFPQQIMDRVNQSRQRFENKKNEIQNKLENSTHTTHL